MITVNILNSSVNYIDPSDPLAPRISLLENMLPSELETMTNQTDAELRASIPNVSKLSTRNHKQAYIVPIEKTEVLLNYIPQKQFVTDSAIGYVINNTFEYFEDIIPTGEEPYTLLNGSIFRPAGSGLKEVNEYTYYIMVDGVAQQIPNFKSVQVLLAERGGNIADLKVVEASDFATMEMGGGALDVSGDWNVDLEDATFLSSFASLGATAASAGALVTAAANQAASNIAAVQAQAEASEAAANAAEAASAAAQAASNAAIAEANLLTSAQVEQLNTLQEQISALGG